MKSTIKHAFGFTFGLLVTLTLIGFQPLVQRTSVRLTGAVMPNSTHTHTYVDKPVRTLSVGGERWKSWGATESASAYHALIILPPVPFSDGPGMSVADGFTHTKIEKWLARTGPQGIYEEKKLEATYDAVRRTVTLGSRTYSLADGNLFVIRFDGSWQPGVTQLNVSITEDVAVDLDLFKSLLRGDEALQKL
jgi:hypothetical protein